MNKETTIVKICKKLLTEDQLNLVREAVTNNLLLDAEEHQLMRLKNNLSKKERSITSWIITKRASIYNQKVDGKKLFSNPDLREAELERQKDTNEDYKEMLLERSKVEVDYKEAEIQYNSYKRENKLIYGIIDMVRR